MGVRVGMGVGMRLGAGVGVGWAGDIHGWN